MSRTEIRRQNIQAGRPMNEGINTSPAEFLKHLDETITPKRWRSHEFEEYRGLAGYEEAKAIDAAIVALRNVLPEIAAVVSSATEIVPVSAFVVPPDETSPLGRLIRDLTALSAAIAREQSR